MRSLCACCATKERYGCSCNQKFALGLRRERIHPYHYVWKVSEIANFDPDRNVQKRHRRMSNFAEGISQTPMSSMTLRTCATSPKTTDFEHGGDVSEEAFLIWT